MITIPISGIIHRFQIDAESNVTPQTLKKSLEDANGEDVLITINSPGGSVWEGLEMFKLIQNYSGKTETRVVSLAASMGSVLALAGDKRSVENTAMYFIHNAQTSAGGDYRELAKAAKWAEDVTILLASLYEKYTSLSLKKARSLMDEDSQFFGKDLEDLGFTVVESGAEVDEAVVRVEAKQRIAEVVNKISADEIVNDFEKVAASIAEGKILDNKIIMSHKKTLNINETQPAAGGDNNTQEEVIMNIDELRANHPDLYNSVFQAGIDAERKRVSAHLKLGATTGAMDKASTFIEEGRSVMEEDVHAEYLTAGMNRNDLNARENDNPDTGQQPEDKGADAHIDAFSAGMGCGDVDLMIDEEV